MQLFTLFLSLLALAFCLAAEFPVEDGVLVLGSDNFDAAIKEHKNILVEFYAPWCGHCTKLAPEFSKAALSLSDSPVKLAKVDATVHGDIGRQFGVKGFPTLKFFKNSKVSDYDGGRTEKEIVRWLQKKTGPSTTTITTIDELDLLHEKHEVFALGAFDSVDSPAAQAFLSAADMDDDHIYAITTSPDIKSKLAVSGETVVVLKAFDDKRVDLPIAVEGLSNAEAITNFVGKFSTAWVLEFSQESSKSIFGSPIKQHVLFFTDKTAAHHKDVITAYRSVAKSFQGEFLFVNVPSSEDKVLEFFGITADEVPAMVLANLGSESGILKFPFPKDAAHTSDAITAFIHDYKNGMLQPHLNSEDVSPDDTTGDVTVVRGKSFKEIVLDSKQDVFIELYASWCQHCKALAPTWEALGKAVNDHKDKIIIAKMDATANEVSVPGMAVQGFPTIYFFPAGDKEHPIKYEDKRELVDFLQFLEKNGHPDLGLTAAVDDENDEL